MKILWVFIAIASGDISPGPGAIDGLVSATLEFKSYMYFETEEDCNAGRDWFISMDDPTMVPMPGMGIEYTDCEPMEVEVETEE